MTHGLVQDQAVTIAGSSETYYVNVLSSTTFTLAATPGGSAVAVDEGVVVIALDKITPPYSVALAMGGGILIGGSLTLTTLPNYANTRGGVRVGGRLTTLPTAAMRGGIRVGGSLKVSGYSESVLADTPVGYWKLDETSGTTAFDYSGNDFHGTYNGGYTQEISTIGILGKGISTDGSTGYINIPDNTTLRVTNPFALELWFKPANLTQSETYIFSKGNDFAIIWEYVNNTLELYSGEVVNFRTGSQLLLTDTNWTHIVYDYDGSNLKGYINGVQQFSVAKSLSLGTSSQALRIGNTAGGGAGTNFVAGSFAHVALYNKSIGADRVAAHYNTAIS